MAVERSQITAILKQILELMQKKDNEATIYNARHIPMAMPRDERIDVYVRVSILRIGEIDAVRQEFQCEFHMTLRWVERRLIGKDTSNVGIIDWDPRYYFINAVKIQDHELRTEIRRDNPPQVILRCHIIGTFKEILKIDNFPFDYQDLSLTLTSRCSIYELTFEKDPEKDDNIRTAYFYPKQEWELRPHVITSKQELKPEKGASPNHYPQYKIRLNVMRQCKFYIYNIVLIMCLITALTFLSFAVKAGAPGDRIQITLTLLLTSVAFIYHAQQFVPTVSYLTLIDKYILACVIFQFFMAIQNAISGLLSNSELLSTFEWICLEIAVFGFAVIHVYFGYVSWKCTRDAKKKMERDSKTYIDQNPPHGMNMESIRWIP